MRLSNHDRRKPVFTMRAQELADFMAAAAPAPRGKKTCDGFKAGDPDTELSGIGVTWMVTMPIIHQAVQAGINCLITHEPTFYNHWDDLHASDGLASAKQRLIAQQGLVIYRLHDGWDVYPVDGILDSWARLLGWSEEIGFDGAHKVYHLPPITLHDLALHVKTEMALAAIRYHGDPARSITKTVLGVGAWGQIDDVRAALALGADCLVTGETCEWQALRYAEDAGLGMIVAGHINSENPGLRNLAAFIRGRLPIRPVVFLDAGEPYRYF